MTEQCEFESIVRQDLTSKEAEHDKRRKELEHDAALLFRNKGGSTFLEQMYLRELKERIRE